MVVLDTSIIIDHLRQLPEKSALIKITNQLPDDIFSLSIISIQELYEGQSTKNPKQERDLLSALISIKVLLYPYDIARLAGQIMRDLGKAISFADAAIAATAIVNDSQLYTLNKKDFRGIKNLELL